MLGDGNDRSKQTRFGKALARLRDRVFAGYRIMAKDEDHSGRSRYRLQPIEDLSKREPADVVQTSGRRSRPTYARKKADVIFD